MKMVKLTRNLTAEKDQRFMRIIGIMYSKRLHGCTLIHNTAVAVADFAVAAPVAAATAYVRCRRGYRLTTTATAAPALRSPSGHRTGGQRSPVRRGGFLADLPF